MDVHTEWSKSVTEKQIQYINMYLCDLEKLVQMNPFAEQKLRHRCREQKIGHDWAINTSTFTDKANKGMDSGEGEGLWWDALVDWDWHIYTIDTSNMHEIDN